MPSGDCAGQVCGHGKHQLLSSFFTHQTQAAGRQIPTRGEGDCNLTEWLLTPGSCWNGSLHYMSGRMVEVSSVLFCFLTGRISHLIAKLQFIRCQHDDVIIDCQHSFSLNLVIREKAVAQLVLFGSHNFERHTDLWPERLCEKQTNNAIMTMCLVLYELGTQKSSNRKNLLINSLFKLYFRQKFSGFPSGKLFPWEE